MEKEKDRLYCPGCLVNYLHWELHGKMLLCRNCPLRDRCREYQAAIQSREP